MRTSFRRSDGPAGGSSLGDPGLGVITRAFVVGCPRSGTSLLQVMLGAHPHIFTLPETHYFVKVWGRLWRKRRMAKEPVARIVSPRAAAQTLDTLVRSAETRPAHVPPRWWPFLARYGRAFLDVMDAATIRAGRIVWVEKSPAHLHFMATIARSVPQAKFIHIVRDGRAVVASFYDLCLTQPWGWIGQVLYGDWRSHLDENASDLRILRAAVERWNSDVTIALQSRSDANHLVVRYDDLVVDPEGTLETITSFIGVRYTDEMLRFQKAAVATMGWRGSLPQAQGVFGRLHGSDTSKFDSLSAHEQEVVTSGLLAGGDTRLLFGPRA